MNVNQRSKAPLFIEERENRLKEMHGITFDRLQSVSSSLNESLFAEFSSQNSRFFFQIGDERSKSPEKRIFVFVHRRTAVVAHRSDFFLVDLGEFFFFLVVVGLRKKLRNKRSGRIRIVLEDLRQLFSFSLACHFLRLMKQE